ncbi:hypothetical protein KI387_012236, partial [Taxus chinensis]
QRLVILLTMKQQIEEAAPASSTSSPRDNDNSSGGNNYDNNLSVLSHVEKMVSRVVGRENAEEPRDGGGQDSVIVERRDDYSAVCKWTIAQFSKVKARALWSRYFEVGGYDCRLLVYPRGDSQALPGYLSIYLQVMAPRGPSSSKWDCFASYRLCVVNQCDETKSIQKDSWHRFSAKKKSHGWCDFTQNVAILDPKAGFVVNDAVLITAEILVLLESVSFSRVNELQSITSPMPEVLSGKFTWKVYNFSLFKDMIKTQKIMSPIFPAGECNLQLSVYQSSVNGVEYLSMCLESKDTEKSVAPLERSCWCLFRMSVLIERPGMNHMHRDSYGRFAADNKSGDNTSLGWNDYMQMTDFVSPEMGFLSDDTAMFSTSFHVIKESSGFSRSLGASGGRSNTKKSDSHQGRFTWRIENFTRLKDILKKRKITGLCVKSRRFQVGNHDCRLIVYPRGQSQPPCHLSMFLEVTDVDNNSADWSCFVSHRLSVMNQRYEERSVTKESQNRYSKTAKDWGWREFVTLTSLFDQDSGFLVQDTVVFSAEVLILKEISTMQNLQDYELDYNASGSEAARNTGMTTFMWKVENVSAFKEIMETKKIFSKFFQAGGCELRIGVYESFDTLCIYLESDQSVGIDPDKNFWVRYRMAVVNQKHHGKTVWKESSICTKTWNNSVLQFMKVFDMLDPDAGFLIRGTVVFVCEILDCCPWFEFSDLEMMVSDDEQDALSTDPDELIDSDDSEGINGDEEDMFRSLLARAGFHLTYGDNPSLLLDPSQLQITLRETLLMDVGAIAGFLTGLRLYLDDPVKVKRLLLPTKLTSVSGGNKRGNKVETLSPSLINLLMGVKVLQQAIIDLLLDIMVDCCQTSEGKNNGNSEERPKDILDANVASISGTDLALQGFTGTSGSARSIIDQRLDGNVDGTLEMQAVQNNNSLATNVFQNTSILPGSLASESGAQYPSPVNNTSQILKPQFSEQSDELLRLIVSSLRALDCAVPQDGFEPQRRPESAQKFAFVLEKSPRYLKEDLIALAPNLVDASEHQLAAFVLLSQLPKTDSESALLLPVLGALHQLEIGSEVWEQVLCQALGMLTVFNDDPLAAVIGSIFKAAAHCQQVPQVARAVRGRLKVLGASMSPPVLDCVRTVASQEDIAEALLRDIDSDFEKGECDCTEPTVNAAVSVKESKGTACQLQFTAEKVTNTCSQVADVYILVEILSVPSLRIETQNVFERAISRGAIGERGIAMFLERRHSQNPSMDYRCHGFDSQSSKGIASESFPEGHEEFSAVLGLAEALTLSKNTRVKEFVSFLYAAMFKVYKSEGHREQMLTGLVKCTTANTNGCHEMDLCMDILSILVQEEGAGRSVLHILHELAQLASADRAALQQRLRLSEEEIIRVSEHRQDEITSLSKEKAFLSKRLTDAAATQTQIKSEMKAEMDRFAREKRDLSERLQEADNQLEWIRLEHAEEITKLAADKKIIQDRLRDAETQLTQLKSRKRDELKRVVKEKNYLAERLKNAESARKRFDEEKKRFETETVSRDEVRQSLEDEIQRLRQTVGQTEGGLREKEEQIKRCGTYINGMEAKLDACEGYIQSLEASLQEEMSRHAPLYGAGLEALSVSELDTLVRIHEEGLRQVRAIQQQQNGGSDLLAANLDLLINIHEKFRNYISILNSKYQNENDLPDLDTLSSLLIQEEWVMENFDSKETTSQELFSHNHKSAQNRNNNNPNQKSNIISRFKSNPKSNYVKNSQNFKFKFNGTCNKCGKFGHKESDCHVKTNKSVKNTRNSKSNSQKKDQKQNHANIVEQSIALYTALSASNDNEWILDSGASRHMTCISGILSDVVKCLRVYDPFKHDIVENMNVHVLEKTFCDASYEPSSVSPEIEPDNPSPNNMETKVQEDDYPDLDMMEIEGESSQNVLHPKIPKWAQNLVKDSHPVSLRKDPYEDHWKMAKIILKYVKGTINYGLFYSSCDDAKLFGYCDFDHVGDAIDRKSTSGYVFKLGAGVITWSSKKQPTMSISSTEAEYRSVMEATKEAMWLKRLLDELDPHADTLKSPSNMDVNPTEPVVVDSQRDEHRVELVSSILNKLQCTFNALKAWEVFTDTTRNAIARDCSELITLVDQLAEDSGSPRARNVVADMKNLI